MFILFGRFCQKFKSRPNLPLRAFELCNGEIGLMPSCGGSVRHQRDDRPGLNPPTWRLFGAAVPCVASHNKPCRPQHQRQLRPGSGRRQRRRRQRRCRRQRVRQRRELAPRSDQRRLHHRRLLLQSQLRRGPAGRCGRSRPRSHRARRAVAVKPELPPQRRPAAHAKLDAQRCENADDRSRPLKCLGCRRCFLMKTEGPVTQQVSSEKCLHPPSAD